MHLCGMDGCHVHVIAVHLDPLLSVDAQAMLFRRIAELAQMRPHALTVLGDDWDS